MWIAHIFLGNSRNIEKAVSFYGSAREAYKDKCKKMKLGRSENNVRQMIQLFDLDSIKEIYGELREHNIDVVFKNGEFYPADLKRICNSPYLLYVKGNRELLKKKLITVTGSRRPNNEGKRIAAEFVGTFENEGIVPVTGFADGIERTVMESGEKIITVLPCGIFKQYPKSNSDFTDTIPEKGGLVVSPFAPEAGAYRWNYRSRNKMLAAISDATLIVQAGEYSATHMVFSACAEYGKVCYAVPGSIFDYHYSGNNQYIREGAVPVTSPWDIIEDVTGRAPLNPKKLYDITPIGETTAEDKILKILENEPMDIDRLVRESGFDISTVKTVVFSLGMDDLIVEDENGIFRLRLRKE